MPHFVFLVISLALALTACARGSTDDSYEEGFGPGFEQDDGGGGEPNVDASIDGEADGGAGGSGDGSDAGGSVDPDADGGDPEDGDADPPTHPCEGKVCESPPANTCADAKNLWVYQATGTCDDEGECQYARVKHPCEGDCKSGACVDNPCAGVTCTSKPRSVCKDEKYLTVFEAPGSCEDGRCTYEENDVYCGFGCLDDVCNGDPCEGVECKSPPASFCSEPTKLVVYAPVGSCSTATGECSYTKEQERYCEFGCENGQCKGNPCAGVSCNKPPARDCKDANTARTYASAGSCSGGVCAYQDTLTHCPYGCSGGFCKDCSADSDCGVGKWCNGSTCASCNSDTRCGSSCQNCAAQGQKCSAGACVECTADSQCGPGKRCQGNSCISCTTNNACGSSCSPCAAGTFCNGSQCICDATSCGPGSYCLGTSCSPCNVPASCGTLCQSCPATTPVCGGPSVGCQCTESSCGSSSFCATNGQCESCGPQACGNGRCDCGETQASCPADCGAPCPLGLVIGSWNSGDDGWSLEGAWRREAAGYMVAGHSTRYSSSYTHNLTYQANLDLRSCGEAMLSFRVRLDDDSTSFYSQENDKTDKSERLYVQCSGDGGANYVDMTPSPWPPKQSPCKTSYCAGKYNENRGFNWISQQIAIPASCRTSRARFRFQAKGSNIWLLQNPGWYVDDVKVN